MATPRLAVALPREGMGMTRLPARLPARSARRAPRGWPSLLLALALVVAALAPLATPARPVDAETVDEAEQALAMINLYRSWLGIAPMRRDPALDAAASGHARYYQLNYGDPSLAGMGLHQQTQGKPGFTGVTMQDRARNAGYPGWVNENIGLSGSMLRSTDWFIATINHRLPLLDPRYTDIGFGAVNDGSARIEVINVGARSWSDTATPNWVAWPPHGTTGVSLNFWGEAPNPFPGASYPVGYPITVKYLGPGGVTFESVTLTANGQSVPVRASVGSGWLSRQTYMIAATEPLRPGTSYTVTVRATANGAPYTWTSTFQTAQVPGERLARNPGLTEVRRNLPAGVAAADRAVQDLWWAADGPVYEQEVERTWLWGPDIFSARTEPYAESPDGQRRVYYLDKSRMEITHPSADRSSEWYVTNGLLVRDMILGAIQTGDQTFAPASPARVPLAGDPAPDNPDAPTYASLHYIASLAADRRIEERIGRPANETLSKDGQIGWDDDLGRLATLAAYDEVTGHNVADVFHDYLTAREWNPLYVVGRPIAEPYWVWTRVNGVEQWVLTQAFERRLLTYTPGNDPEWRVEMGNVGRHYYEWRYGEEPPGS